MTKQSFHARIWAKLLNYNRRWRLIEDGDRIVLAVSGGPDSVCLAHFLHRLSRRIELRLCILHLNHGLRGKHADRDAKQVEGLGDALGIPTTVEKIPVLRFSRSTGRSVEDAARLLRYRALAQAAGRWNCNKIATGHQMDDQAETVLLNILRGTRAKGLAAIPPRRKLSTAQTRGPEIVRPLLCLTRREVLAYLEYRRLRFATDLSNFSDRYTRNWIRRKALPLLESRSPNIRRHLASIAEEMRPFVAKQAFKSLR